MRLRLTIRLVANGSLHTSSVGRIRVNFLGFDRLPAYLNCFKFLLHVRRQPLAMSRIVSRNQILCEAAFKVYLLWQQLTRKITRDACDCTSCRYGDGIRCGTVRKHGSGCWGDSARYYFRFMHAGQCSHFVSATLILHYFLASELFSLGCGFGNRVVAPATWCASGNVHFFVILYCSWFLRLIKMSFWVRCYSWCIFMALMF